MGEIVQLPKLHAHRETPATSRSASAVIVSASRPARLAMRDSKILRHQSEGMRSRCDHFLTASEPAPMSVAIASGEGHNPMIERKEVNFIESRLGQIVLNGKAKMSPDCGLLMGNSFSMQKLAATAFTDAFQARVRHAREAKRFTQKKIAGLLGVEQDTYKQWETRPGSLLPHEYIERFCAFCGVDLEWLFTGEAATTISPKPPRQRRHGKEKSSEAA